MTPLPTTIVVGSPNHIPHHNTIHALLNNLWTNAMDPQYGGTGLGVANDLTALQGAATAATGKTLYLPPGSLWRIEGGDLVIPANTTVIAYGAQVFNTTAPATVVTLNSGCRWYGGEIYGGGSAAAYSDVGRLISIAGTVGVYKDDIRIEDVYLHSCAGYGIRADFAKNVWVVRPKIYDVAYCGIDAESVDRFHVEEPNIDMNSPVGTSGNAYGITFSRTQGTLAAHPRCTNFSVTGGTVKNVAIWEGLDTHGGQYGSFIGTTVTGCAQAVAVGPSKDGGGTEAFAPKNITVDVVSESFSTTGTANSGVTVAGAAGGEQAEAITIRGSYKGYGIESTTTNGGIDCRDTIGLRIDVMTINCSPNGVILRGNNYGFRIDLTAIDSWSTAATGRALWLNGDNNAGVLTSLVMAHGAKTATSINGEGIRIDNNAGNALGIVGGLYNTGTTPIVDVGTHSFTQSFAKKEGVYGHAVTAQQTGVAVSDAAIHAALVALGWITA